MALSGARFAIGDGDYRAEVAEVGAALAGLWRGDEPVTVDWSPDQLPPKSAGCVLVPWPNRIRDGRYRFEGVDYQLPLTEPASLNASHGLMRWVRWQCLEHGAASVLMGADVVPQTGYPFEIQLRLRYTVAAETGLTVRLTAENIGSSPAPFGAGFHPFLDLGDYPLADAELLIPADTVLRTDERQLPVGRLSVAGTAFDLRRLRPLDELRLDHGFADLTGSVAVLRTERRRLELHWQPAFGYLQVFTPPEITPGRHAVAIEPMSCPADAFNSGAGLVRLAPGQDWTGSWRLVVAG
ncbi:MAG: aldose 1-epimerase family protein [Jatrophihabitantaceae bacterium]